jgi:hypothetical protein
VAAERPLDAVVAVDDQGVRVAALAAKRLGLPGNPPQAAAATRPVSREGLAVSGGTAFPRALDRALTKKLPCSPRPSRSAAVRSASCWPPSR